MAFLNKLGNLVKHSAVKNMNKDLSMSSPSIFQAIRSMSSAKLFVGGISYSTDEMSLRESFARYGEVIDARVIMDRDTGRSRGFAFITFATSEDASSAIQALDGQELHGRRIRVNYATERSRPGFGGGGGYGGGGYGGGGYGGGGYGGNDTGGGSYGSSGYGAPSSYGGGSAETSYASGADAGGDLGSPSGELGGNPGSGYGGQFGGEPDEPSQDNSLRENKDEPDYMQHRG